VLVEALIAFVVLSAVLVTSLGGFSNGATRMRQVEERLTLLGSARAVLVELSSGDMFIPGRMSGTTAENFSWTADVSEMGQPGSGTALRSFRIVLHVTRSFGMSSLRLETYSIGKLGGPYETR
jgi:hypothetical protein